MPVSGPGEKQPSAWQVYDSQSVVREDEQGATVDHRASARENLAAVGRDSVDALNPANHIKDPAIPYGDVNTFLSVELEEIVLWPFRTLKNLLDAVVHGIATLFSRSPARGDATTPATTGSGTTTPPATQPNGDPSSQGGSSIVPGTSAGVRPPVGGSAEPSDGGTRPPSGGTGTRPPTAADVSGSGLVGGDGTGVRPRLSPQSGAWFNGSEPR